MRPRLLMVAALLACWSGGAFGQQTQLPPPIYPTTRDWQKELHTTDIELQGLPSRGEPPDRPVRIGIPNDLRGGSLAKHAAGFIEMRNGGADVEVRGRCWSACTTVVTYLPKDRLCFAADASLGFHMPRIPPTTGEQPGMDWRGYPSGINDGAERMVNLYPWDIREWIDAKGGYTQLPMDGYWILTAPELWKMGYRKCAD